MFGKEKFEKALLGKGGLKLALQEASQEIKCGRYFDRYFGLWQSTETLKSTKVNTKKKKVGKKKSKIIEELLK